MGRLRRRLESYQETNHPDPRYNIAYRRVKRIKGFYNHLAAYVIFNTIIIITNFGQEFGTPDFWKFNTFSIAFFWGIGLAAHGASVFGRDLFFGKEWEERKLRQLMDRDKKQNWE
jgi:hypothetical protein